MSDLAVKSLGNNRIGCYAAIFGSADTTDLVGEFFADDTDFWMGHWDKVPMLYDHATNPAMKASESVIGVWDKSEVHAGKGLWVEGELDKAHKYSAAIQELIDSGVIKPSSDSIDHLVIREPQQNGAMKLACWPLVAVSLTTIPCEPRMLPVAAAKSMFAALQMELGEDAETPKVAAKAAFLGDNIENRMTMGAVDAAFDALRYNVLYECIYPGGYCCSGDGADEKPLPERRAKLQGALAELNDLVLMVFDAILSGESEQTPPMAAKYLDAKKNKTGAISLLDGLTNSEMLDVVLAAAKAYPLRVEGIKSLRGDRFPTAAKKGEIALARKAFTDAVGALDVVIAPQSQPETPNSEPSAAAYRLKAMRSSHKMRQLIPLIEAE